MKETSFAPEERRLQILLRILALVFGLAAFGYLLPALFGPNKDFFVNLPFVTNSAVKVSVLALLSFFAAADVRRYRMMTWLVIVGHIISEIAVGATLIWGETDRIVSMTLPIVNEVLTFPISTPLIGSMVLDGVIIVLLLWFYIAAERVRYGLSYLTPLEFRSLVALSEALIVGTDEKVPPEEMARNADQYLMAFRARTKWIFKLVLNGMQIYPIFSLNPPLSMMDPESRRKYLEDRFYRGTSLLPGLERTLVQIMIRISKQLAYLGYYNDPRTFESIGYVPFTARPDTPAKLVANPPAERKPLRVLTAADVEEETITGDIIIIGSGAGASTLAHGILRENPNRSIVMIERGDYIDRSEMNDNEIDMLSKLYAEGALQLSRDFRFQVLQGSCVGGTTVVNNAVCFDLPDNVLDRWNDVGGLNAGIDPSRLANSHQTVRSLIDIGRQKPDNLNPGALPFVNGANQLGLGVSPNELQVVEANITRDCYGCGYCNIGCQFGKKLSMLDTVLPKIQAEHGVDKLRIVAGCEALKIRGRGRSVTTVECRFKDGKRVNVKGNTIVVSAGTVSSSLILLRSGIGGDRAGKRLSFNMGSPMTGVFDHVVNAYAGLQISHYVLQRPSKGYIIETWFNPPVAQALTMPGWFADHFNNMLRYNKMSSVGVLVPTEANAEVRVAGIFGRDIKYEPTKNDLDHLAEGLILGGEIFFNGGAKSVMPHTLDFHEWKDPADLQQLRSIVHEKGGLTLGTGHPQGGNILSKNPKLGVVNPEFRVYGYDNLYVCDASVFPSSVGVNPQLTVMALADYAAPIIAADSTTTT
ncbi:MAG: GMC family oxidoreductase N-terminal domain-containing protein [Candidatus Kapaibacterium sp.]